MGLSRDLGLSFDFLSGVNKTIYPSTNQESRNLINWIIEEHKHPIYKLKMAEQNTTHTSARKTNLAGNFHITAIFDKERRDHSDWGRKLK